MPLAGFGEEDAPLAIGYNLGLRWFQAVRVSHESWNLRHTINGSLMAQCSCGGLGDFSSPSEAGAWLDSHLSLPPGLFLNGARGRWEPGVNRAVCGMGISHRAPDRDCGCGFWAYWRLGDQQVAQPHIPALVKGYGKVIQGPKGFRCETAEILALVVPFFLHPADGTHLALELEQVYRVPVYTSLDALLEQHHAPESQPPLGDDWFTRPATQQSAWATGYTTWNIGSGNSGWGSGGGGGSGSTSHVRSALSAGVMPCMTCGTMACTTGQARCARCQLGKAQSQLSDVTARMAALKDVTRKTTTGIDALNQLQARRAKWAQEGSTPTMGPPDPEGWGASGIGRDGRRNPPGTQIRWALDYIRRKFGR